MTADFEEMFELAPVSLWLEDFSALQALFVAWRAAGITDLRSHLHADRARIAECSRQVRILRVNRRTLQLFGARDTEHLADNIARVFRDAMLDRYIEELVSLWDGHLGFSGQTVNYTLGGDALDILIHGTVLPGHHEHWTRVLVSTEDISDRMRAQRYAQGLFDESPVSLWVHDFSMTKQLLDGLCAGGSDDLRAHLQAQPEFIERCLQAIRPIDVNRRTLEMFGTPDKAMLLGQLARIFRHEMRTPFAEQLIALWSGGALGQQQREAIAHTLDGDRLDVLLKFSVLPGAEADWRLVQMAVIDITARKKVETELEYVSHHDVLTGLHNRAFFEKELHRLERWGPWPVTLIAIDLDRLKATNDQRGHAAGDALLRRAGAVLARAAEAPACAARTGGDEFVLLLPGSDPAAGERMAARVMALIADDNAGPRGDALSLSLGCATAHEGEALEAALARADERMFAAKRGFYAATGHAPRSLQDAG